MNMLIARFSDQEQGIELYELLQRKMRIFFYKEMIQQQLNSIFETANFESRGKTEFQIAIFGIIIAVLDVVIEIIK